MEGQLNTSAAGSLLDARPVSRFQAWTILLCGIVVILDGFDTQCVGVLVPVIADDLHIAPSSFGPVLAAALFGLMIAAMASGPIADRYGRRWVVIVSVLVFAIFALWTARAQTLRELIVLRFLTGLGLGGAMPNAVALTSEYTPRRLQPIVVGAIFVGMPAGGLLASQVAALLIPIWGWRSVFVVGGALPLVVAIVLVKLLPESVRFLNAQGRNPKEVSRIMRRISPDLANVPVGAVADDQPRRGVPVKHLFTEGRAAGTLLLWVPFFMNLLILYFVLSWLPQLLRQLNLPVLAGAQAVAAFSLGGIFGTLFQVRATGIGWALGVGRIGSIVGPSLGGVLLSLKWTPDQIFVAGVIPALCAAVAIVLTRWLPEDANAFRTAA